MSMIGKTYLLKGEPVVVLVKWRHTPTPKGVKGPPRNVLIQFSDGSKTVRPFRGLRTIKPADNIPE